MSSKVLKKNEWCYSRVTAFPCKWKKTWNDAIIIFAVRSAYAYDEYKSRRQIYLCNIFKKGAVTRYTYYLYLTIKMTTTLLN